VQYQLFAMAKQLVLRSRCPDAVHRTPPALPRGPALGLYHRAEEDANTEFPSNSRG